MIILSIVSIRPLIVALAIPPCLIATIKKILKFGAIREKFHEERIYLQVLKIFKEESSTVLELHRARRGVGSFSAVRRTSLLSPPFSATAFFCQPIDPRWYKKIQISKNAENYFPTNGKFYFLFSRHQKKL